MFKKIPLKSLEPSLAEAVADLAYEIGKSRLAASQWDIAIQWLEKGYDSLLSHNLETMSKGAEELGSDIVRAIVEGLMRLKGDCNVSKAWNLIRSSNFESPNKLALLLLRLELHETDHTSSISEYHDVLQNVVQMVAINDTNMNAIFYHLHTVRRRSPREAHSILLDLIAERLLKIEGSEWLEKALVTLVWNCTTSSGFPDALGLLQSTFDVMIDSSKEPISTSATHAAQVVGTLIQSKVSICALTDRNSYSGSVSRRTSTAKSLETPKLGAAWRYIKFSRLLVR